MEQPLKVVAAKFPCGIRRSMSLVPRSALKVVTTLVSARLWCGGSWRRLKRVDGMVVAPLGWW